MVHILRLNEMMNTGGGDWDLDEIRIDFFDEDEKRWSVDVWVHGNEEGECVAYIYEDGRVEFCDPDAKSNAVIREEIAHFIRDQRKSPKWESRRANARGRALNEWDETASLTSPKVIEQEDGDVTYSVMKFVEGGVRPHWEECKPITGSGTYNTKQQAIDSIRRERNVTTYRIIEKREVATVIFE